MKKVSISVCVVLMLISAFVAFQITYTHLTDKYESTKYGFSKWSEITGNLDSIERAAGSGTGTEWQDIYTTLSEVDSYMRAGYVGEIDEENLLSYLMAGYTYGTGDKYCAYMDKKEYAAYEMSSQESSLVGIGVRISYDNTLGGIYITSVVPSSPAERAGILPGDVIIGVADKEVSEYGYYNSYNLIKNGTEGEEIELRYLTALSSYKEEKKVSVARETVSIPTVSSKMLDGETAYVDIVEFNMTTSDEFKAEMQKLEEAGAKRYIFDVRNNPGGVVTAVAGVLDYLLPEGPIIRAYSKNGSESVINSDAKELVAPMVVLTNGSTASGGELFAAALRDYEKATLIGTKTYGKGTMQTIIPLSNGGALKFSTQMYNPPKGENYEGIGIEPDIKVELSEEAMKNFYKLSEKEDLQLRSAIDTVHEMPTAE